MRPIHGRIRPLFSLAALMVISTSHGQEFFREFGSSRSTGGIGRLAPATTIAPVVEGNEPGGTSPLDAAAKSVADEHYNFRLGQLDFVVGAGVGVEFNSNVNLTNRDRLSDIILRPGLDFKALLRISDDNELRFGVGLGYAKYLDHDEFDSDSVLIAPSSGFAWKVRNGSVTFTLRDRVSYQEDPFDLPPLSGVATYPRWENQAGFQVDWEANERTTITVGYDRYDLWAKDEEFESQDRGTDTVYLRPARQLSPYVTVGLNGTFSWVDFRESIQADTFTCLIGPYLQWKASDNLDVYLEAGYQRSDFDGGTVTLLPNGTVRVDDDDFGSVYGKLELRHRIGANFQHGLIASRTAETGFGSNFYDLYHIEYSAQLKLDEATALTGQLFYEHYDTSGSPDEQANRFGTALGLRHTFANQFTLGLDYRFLLKNSNQPDADYHQHLGLLSLYYRF